jgi:hypothetical protein
MASFDGVTFTVDGATFQERREGRVAIQEIPGGDNFFVDRAGRRPLFWSFGLVVANATDWGTLHTKIGVSGTLAVELHDSETATLLSLTAPTTQVDGQQRGNAEFVITSA